MDLKKLDPMARKMRTRVDAFYKALEDNDGFSARNHINEILKYADYLSTDVESAVMKQDDSIKGVNDIYAGGVPIMKMKEIQTIHQSAENVLPGTIRTSRFGKLNRRLSNRTL
jgi:hypothetical protein|tara:strand:- start:1187 stop:1525 length:339 start_codon:yes stop_codon:yes gene_type:complete